MRSLPVPPHGLGSLGIRVGPGILCSPLSSLSRCWMSWFYRWFSKMERLMFQSSQVRFKKNFLCLRLKKKSFVIEGELIYCAVWVSGVPQSESFIQKCIFTVNSSHAISVFWLYTSVCLSVRPFPVSSPVLTPGKHGFGYFVFTSLYFLVWSELLNHLLTWTSSQFMCYYFISVT